MSLGLYEEKDETLYFITPRLREIWYFWAASTVNENLLMTKNKYKILKATTQETRCKKYTESTSWLFWMHS